MFVFKCYMSKLQNIISADYNRQELNFKEQNLQTPCLIRLEKQSKLPTATVGSAMGGGDNLVELVQNQR